MPDPGTVVPRRDTGRPAHAPALAAWIVSVLSLLLVVYVWVVSTIGWRAGDFNLAEAASYGDAGEVERLIENGANPQALYPVRAFVLRRDEGLTLSPMQAAIKDGRTDAARRLVARGAVAGAVQAEELRCLAAEEHRTAIADLLAAAYPDQQAPCRVTEKPW